MTRKDRANQYIATNRLDQGPLAHRYLSAFLIWMTGVGLILAELEKHGRLNDTLIVYFSDNGIPFPAAKTNLWDAGEWWNGMGCCGLGESLGE